MSDNFIDDRDFQNEDDEVSGLALGDSDGIGIDAREEIERRAFVDRVSAEIGDLVLHDEFANPDVDVTHNRQTAEHDIVSSYDARGTDIEYVVQTMGKEPPEIDITAWVSEDQLPIVDDLASQRSVEVLTDRWTGVAVPINVDTPYERAFHDTLGRVYEVTIELLGIKRDLDPNGGL